MFYAAEAWGREDVDSVAPGDAGRMAYNKEDRVGILNIETRREGGDSFIFELQVKSHFAAFFKLCTVIPVSFQIFSSFFKSYFIKNLNI